MPTSTKSLVGIPLDIVRVANESCQLLSASLDCHLGSGAYKHAFLIKRSGQQFALKIAPVTPSLRARFEREATALQDCRHPAIAVLHYVAPHTSSGSDYWIMCEEFLSGGTLSERLSAGLLSRTETQQLGVTLAEAIAHLQTRSFVHRDIKPGNILFRTPSEPVLTDFGIVRILGEPSLTHDFMSLGPGTPLYAAPEQLLNEKASIDWRTDQFGLALVLSQCLLGRHPFTPAQGSPLDAIAAVANRSPLPAPAQLELEQHGFGFLTRCLSPWPVGRFRRPADLVAMLKGVM